MTPHPEVVLVESIVHAIRSNGSIGGTTECLVGFRWKRTTDFKTTLGEKFDQRPRGCPTPRNVNCVFCLGA